MPMSVSSKLVILVALAVLFGATMIALSVRKNAPAGSDENYWGESKNIDKTFKVKTGDKLILDADEGDIAVSGQDSEELVVHVSVRGSESLTKNYKVDMDQDGGVVTIRARHDRRMFHWFDNNSLDIKYDIQLPKKFNVRLETSGGNIDLAGVDGELRGQTSGGDLRIDDVHGKVNISTSGGNVKVRKSTGELTFGTSGGDIVGDDLAGTLNVETSGGNISIMKAEGALHASTSGGNIRVELMDNKGIDLSTSGGSVTLTLPKSATGDVNAETSGGEVSCDFPFNGKIRDGSFHGTINGGGERIRLESSGGDIVIHAVD